MGTWGQPRSRASRGGCDVDHLFGQSLVGIVRLDPSWRIVHANHAAARIIYRPIAHLDGVDLADLLDPDVVPLLAEATAQLTDVDHVELPLRIQRGDTSTALRATATAYRGPHGEVESLVMLLSDAGLAHLHPHHVTVDPLTNLATRGLFVALLEEYLDDDVPLLVVALDIDRFRAVNDQLGQLGGDAVLTEVAARLLEVMQPGDLAARAGSDDFLLVLRGVGTMLRVNAVARGLLGAISDPLTIGGLALQLSASIGLRLVAAGEGRSADHVISDANAALRTARRRGRSRFEVYDAAMGEAVGNRLRIEASLRGALETGAIDVAYQPLVRLADGATAGAEALARWSHPLLGTVEPDAFMPIAEESGLVEPLTTLVLSRAIADLAVWRAETRLDVHVAVNLSAQDLSGRSIASEVAALVAAAGIPPRSLRLEIVETELVEAGPVVLRNMASLRDLGVSLGIDDFGKGYSSLSYLKDLPVDFLKIDRSYITGLGAAREDTAIVRAVIALAKSLDLQVVAEGIERPSQLRLLRELGCDLGQGYLIGHADSAEVFRDLLVPRPTD